MRFSGNFSTFSFVSMPTLVLCYIVNFFKFSGVIDTNFHDHLGLDHDAPEYAAVMEQFAKMHPLGRVGQSEDVRPLVFYLIC